MPGKLCDRDELADYALTQSATTHVRAVGEVFEVRAAHRRGRLIKEMISDWVRLFRRGCKINYVPLLRGRSRQ